MYLQRKQPSNREIVVIQYIFIKDGQIILGLLFYLKAFGSTLEYHINSLSKPQLQIGFSELEKQCSSFLHKDLLAFLK